MPEYPKNLVELEEMFSTPEGCRDYLEKIRWPNGFCCPKCGNPKAWRSSRWLWVCSGCQRQTSVTAGTIFQDTHKDLQLWFRVIWWVCSQKHGVSALGLQRMIGFGSYETAWAWLHKLRRIMVLPGRDLLAGSVEVDETYWGSEHSGPRGRGALGKVLIALAVEFNEKKIGRIRMARCIDGTAKTLTTFVSGNVKPSSEVVTDGNSSYETLKEKGYRHKVVVGKTLMNKDLLLPHVHLVVSLLKRWMLGTHQGAIKLKQLDYYLDEFTFRFNRRTSKSRGLLFYRIIQQTVNVKPWTYQKLVHSHLSEKPLPVGVT